MVWSLEGEAERPPLSVILPRFYLGAESDVTQDRLASLGISYVLSVSRCSPQPSFLPCSRYLRIPIDDSLWDDLLPWIPQALHFIDAAMSSGDSVLVHCAAGISRSPALAVAYIMYSLGLDLDQAYRFVKERRPSISPNFNFLGQLQHFQATLHQKASTSSLHTQQLDNRPPPSNDNDVHIHTRQRMSDPVVSSVTGEQTHRETFSHAEQRHADGGGNQPSSWKRRTLHLTLSQNQQEAQTPCEVPSPNPCPAIKPAPKPAQQVPPGSVSLWEKRKSLTLSLTPLGSSPPPPGSSIGQRAAAQKAQSSETVERPEAKTQGAGGSHRPSRAQDPTHSQCRRAAAKEQGSLSPFSFTLSKLLDWGERLLLGEAFVHPVRIGQPALPYRC
ncbi:dual specificity protein phosphatase 8 [Betta splendens]|uniref:protein-tyrosine-phosphatase n=1 Tax=Betta splendens TaxID=158456 RepID=A0A6P7N9B8_BETSP|nr:dual specificity protein phosphatase 8 [Betta splendens]